MRYRYLGILILSISVGKVYAQQSVIWEPVISVADGSLFGNNRPRLSLTSGDNPVVLFSNTSNGEIYTARYNGAAFDSPLALLPSGESSYHANWTGPDIAASGDDVVVVYKAQPYATAHVYTVKSNDGGITFSDTIRADNHDIGQTWMPAIAMDDNGNPIVTYMIFDATGGDERIAVAKSLDGGTTYEPQVNTTAGSPGVACDCCPPEVTASGNYLAVMYRNNESNIRDGFTSLSLDSGANFTSVANMDNLIWSIMSCPSTGPHGAIVGDSIYYVSASKASGEYRVYLSTAGLNNGINLATINMMNPPTSLPSDSQNFPRISASNDTIVTVWEERESGNSNIMISITTDGIGQTLSAYKSMVNPNLSGTQSKPDVIYSDGYVHVVYQDFSTGDVMYRKGIVADVTGIDDAQFSQIKVYPNPALKSIQITGVAPDKVISTRLLDASGKLYGCVIHQGDTSITLDLSSLKSGGVYTIELQTEEGQVYRNRIVVI